MRFRLHIVSHRIDTPVLSRSSKLRKENDATINKNNLDIKVLLPRSSISCLGSYKSNAATKLRVKAKARLVKTTLKVSIATK